jgi:hypothetical protein
MAALWEAVTGDALESAARASAALKINAKHTPRAQILCTLTS